MVENWKNKILCKLKRSTTPIKNDVEIDDAIRFICKDNEFDSSFFPFEFPDELKNIDFKILAIIGSSGTGKSTFSKYFGKEESVSWDNSKAIISQFKDPDDAVTKLGAVGLNSIPTWCKPRNVLSVGEGFRCDLARRLKSNCVIDEFTSTVDRNVALSCANSIGRFIRHSDLTGCVFVSCHKDFIDVLCPDYVIDLDDQCIYDTRDIEKRKFELQIYEKTNKKEIWNVFKKHHYLSSELQLQCKLYVAYLNNEMVGMIAICPLPSAIPNARRVHRLVILPDYQGLGIASRLLEYICDLYSRHTENFYIRTSHVKLRSYFEHKKNMWKETNKNGESVPSQSAAIGWKTTDRIAYSFKYILPCQNIPGRNYDLIAWDKKEKIQIETNDLFGG